jgi:hypothetical protein
MVECARILATIACGAIKAREGILINPLRID